MSGEKLCKRIAMLPLCAAFIAGGTTLAQDGDTEQNAMAGRNTSTVEPLSLRSSESAPAGKVPVSQRQGAKIIDRSVLFERGKINPKNTQNRATKAELSGDGRRHMLMQFDTMPNAEKRAMLAGRGIRILSYLPNQTYWVAVDTVARATAAVEGIHWAWVPDPIYKVSLRIDGGDFPPNAVHADGTVSLQVLLFEDVNSLDAREIIDTLGDGVRVVRQLDGKRLEVRSPKYRISDIADLDAVRWVEPAAPPRMQHNAVAASRVNADVLLDTPYNVDGSPVNVGIWDGGAVYEHSDFGSRLTVYDSLGVSSHSTHVAGTVGGSGGGNLDAKGMAPSVQLQSYDWYSDTGEMRTAATTRGVVISNHSYGFITGWYWDGGWLDNGNSSGFGLYDSNAQEYDDVVVDTGLLVFKSAGNDRDDGPDCPSGPDCDGPYDSIGYVGNAKNILTICALDDIDDMTSFSSWGPSDDGRIKPDLCANGYGLTSTLPGNSYGPSSGTSMSSPSAAGTAALLFEHFQNQFSTDPSAETLKTLMIHGANDLGRSGPDYEFGWGIIDAEVSADLISGASFMEGIIDGTGGQQEYAFEVATSSPVKLTLGWTDPAGSPAAAKALVNNLDLVLIAPSGTPHYPWVLDPLNPSNPATTGVNDVDNIEQVAVNAPEIGIWTARVSGYAVPLGPQSFTLVASSLAVAVPSIPSTPDASDGTYTDRVQVIWSSVSGATSYKVFRCADTLTSSCGSGYTASASPYDDTSASAGVTYYYRIQACNGAGCSDYSAYDSGYVASGQPGTLQFASETYVVNENDGSVTVSVTRTGGSDGAASVSYSTADESAIAGPDYTAKTGTLNWTDGDSGAKSFAVTIKNNGAVEGNEIFTINLSSVAGASLGSPTSTSVTIVDDEGPQSGIFQFSSATYSVDENEGSVTVQVTRTEGSDGAASVSYGTTDGSATAGSDYTAKSDTLNWADGDSATKSFEVFITDDDAVEDNEEFAINLSGAVGASLGSPASTSVTIVDDEPPVVSCSGTEVLIYGHIFEPGVHECVATSSIRMVDTDIAPSADVRITSPATFLGSGFRVLAGGTLSINTSGGQYP